MYHGDWHGGLSLSRRGPTTGLKEQDHCSWTSPVTWRGAACLTVAKKNLSRIPTQVAAQSLCKYKILFSLPCGRIWTEVGSPCAPEWMKTTKLLDEKHNHHFGWDLFWQVCSGNAPWMGCASKTSRRFVDHDLVRTGSFEHTQKSFRHPESFIVGESIIYILYGKMM